MSDLYFIIYYTVTLGVLNIRKYNFFVGRKYFSYIGLRCVILWDFLSSKG